MGFLITPHLHHLQPPLPQLAGYLVNVFLFHFISELNERTSRMSNSSVFLFFSFQKTAPHRLKLEIRRSCSSCSCSAPRLCVFCCWCFSSPTQCSAATTGKDTVSSASGKSACFVQPHRCYAVQRASPEGYSVQQYTVTYFLGN